MTAACQAPLSFTMSQSLLKLMSFALQHWTLLSLPDISTTDCPFPYGPAALFFLELLVTALCCSPVAYWTPSNLGGLISWCHIFLSFHTVHGVLTTGILEWVAISSSHRSRYVWALHYNPSLLGGPPCMAYSFIEVCKSSLHDKALIHEGEQCLIVFFLYFASVYINWYIILSS